MANFPIYCHIQYDIGLNKNGKFEIVCKDVSDHDFVEVVRCKYCVNKDFCRTYTTWATPPGDNWFCADGKRRSDLENH